jgi:light-regulated signal transduction histidine kinase (bacteriophytochrome)
VVSNLISNAAKYSPPTTPIEPVLTADGDAVQVSVADRGIGLEPTNWQPSSNAMGGLAARSNARFLASGLVCISREVSYKRLVAGSGRNRLAAIRARPCTYGELP